MWDPSGRILGRRLWLVFTCREVYTISLALDNGPAEVFQASQLPVTFGIFDDGFESGDTSEWNPVVP